MGELKLTACMKVVAKMGNEDQDSLLERLDRYTADGVPKARAQIMAASDTLAELIDERKEFMAMLREQHPDLFHIKPDAKPANDIKRSPARDMTDTPEFKRWFGDSKVVDADGKPLVVYHGTKADFSAFNKDQGGRAQYYGDGIYLTDDRGQASSYAGKDDGSKVMPVYAALKNPFIEGESSFNGGKAFVATELRKDLIRKRYEKAGFDGVILKRGWVIAFRPEQIKSAIGNNGQFDPTNPDITKSTKRIAEKWKDYAEDPTGFNLGNSALMQSKSIDDLAKAFSGNGISLSAESNGGIVSLVVNGDPYNGEMLLIPSGDGYKIDATGARGLSADAAGAGQRMYQAMLAYAHNNGVRIYPSADITGINRLRRTSAQMSAALRFGTTDFMGAPHRDQDVRGWRDGDFDGNIAALAEAEMRHVMAIGDINGKYRLLENGTVVETPVDARAGEQEPVDAGSSGAESRGGVRADRRGDAGVNESNRNANGSNAVRRDGRDQVRSGPEAARGDLQPAAQRSQPTGKAVTDEELRSHLASIGGGIGEHGVGVATLKRALATEAWLNGRDASPQDGLLYSTKRNDMGFYSALAKGIEDMQTKAAPAGAWKAQIKGLVNKGVVKQDEVTWSGVEDFLDLQEGKITKEQIAAYLEQGGVQVEEVVLADTGANDWSDYAGLLFSPDGESKYSKYTLPGGENYREVLLTLPKRKIEVVARQSARAGFEDEMKSKYGGQTFPSVYSRLSPDEVDRYERLVREDRNNERNDRAAADNAANYKSSHWDQPNVLAHIRVNDRTDAGGKKTLFVEEIQSDWGQDGKKKGVAKNYRPDEVQPISAVEAGKMTVADEKLFWHFKTPDNIFSIPKSKYEDRDAARDYIIREKKINSGGVPDAPFIGKTEGWLNLALKRVIAMAVDGGYDKVAFVNGEQSADRYDLSKQVDSIHITKLKKGGFEFTARQDGREIISRETVPDASALAAAVGKELAEKADSQDLDSGKTYSGIDLKVGGEGMKAFYDKIVPNAVKALLKKVGGGQMEMVGIPDSNAGREVVAAQVPGESMWGVYDRQKGQWLESWYNETYTSDPENAELTSEKTAKNIASAIMRDAGVMLDQPGFTITDNIREKVSAEGLPLFSKQRAYHGTPHRGIERFSTEKIGTGEGAQAYGWGLYFASQKDIAEWYRRGLSRGVPVVKLNGRTLKGDVLNTIANKLNDSMDAISKDDVIAEIDRRLAAYTTGGDVYAKWAVKELQDARKKLDKAKSFEVDIGDNLGQLYEVDIPWDDEMLLWDKPLSEQPEMVREIALKLAAEVYADEPRYSPEYTRGMELYRDLSRKFGTFGSGDKAASEVLAATGVKGIKYLDGTSRSAGDGSYNYVVFSDDDIEIVKTHYSKKREDPLLSALHNLTEQNLIYADQIGGLAVPSIAVVKDGMGMDGFGQITLIAGKSLADPKENPVYSSDAYSPRWPNPEYNKVKWDKVAPLMNAIRPFEDEFGDSSPSNELNQYAYMKADPGRLISDWLRSNAVKAMYLAERGTKVKPVLEPMKPQVPFAHSPAWISFAKKADWSALYGDSTREQEEAFIAEASLAARKAVDEYVATRSASGPSALSDVIQSSITNTYFNEDGEVKYGYLSRMRDDAVAAGKKRVNQSKTGERLDRKIGRNAEAFKSWVESKLLPMYGEPFLTIGRSKVPYTIDNIAKAMSGSVVNKEDTITYGAGKVRASMSTKFSSLQHMRNASYQISDRKSYEKAKNATEKLLSDFRMAALDYYKGTDWRGQVDTFDAMDDAMRAIAMAIKTGATPASMRKALTASNFKAGSMPLDVIELGVSAAQALASAPVPYFESKPQRVVDLNEFKGAAIPQGTSKAAKEVLQRHGIPFKIYKPTVDGDKERVINSLRKTLDKKGEDVLFSRQRNPQIDTPEFKRWFGDSKVVDENGEPLVVYHGTKGDVSSFDIKKAGASDPGLVGRAFYFTPSGEQASSFAESGMYGRGDAPNVMPVYLSPKNPAIIRDGVLSDGRSLRDVHPQGITKSSAASIRKELERQGYDGAIFYLGDDATQYVAFRPEQIKSAIGNNGNFDPENPDIRKSTGRTAAGADWDSPSASKFDDVVYKLQDKNIDLKRVKESIEAASGALADDLNVYLQEELYHGRAAKRTEDFVNMELTPLIEQMKADGLEISDVEEFLHARHAPEANKVIAQRNPGAQDLQDGGSGMKTADALDYMSNLDPATRAKLEAAAAKVDAIIKKTREMYVDYELESKSTVDAWDKMFDHYIPLQREDKDAGPGLGQGFSVKGRETKGRTGSTRKVVDILANIAIQREKAIVRGEKNRVSQALVGMAKANPNEGFWVVDEVPTERVFNPNTGLVEDRVDPLYKSRPNAVIAKIKGADGKVREHAVLFNEEDQRALRMAQAMKNLDAANLEGLMGVSASITRYFAASVTQWNPLFGPVNLIRDVQAVALNLSSTPIKGDERKVMRNVMPALAGVYKDLRAARKGQNTNSQWARLWDEFQEVGGQTGYRELFRTSADRAEAIKKALSPDAWADSKLGKIFTANGALKVPLVQARRAAGWIFDWLSDYNDALENGVRLAVYKAALDRGLSKEQAASIAKNASTNFNRKGQIGQQAGALYAFFNAAVQGTARIGDTLFDMEPGKPKTIRVSGAGKKIIGGGVLLGAIQAVMLAAAGFDDEDPPQFARERALIIPIGDKKYLSIPMPLGFNVIPNIGRISTEFAMSGFKSPHERAVQLISLFSETFNPIGSAGLSMQTLAPTALDPFVALTENKDWTGKPIARESSNKAIPGHAMAKDTATTWSKVISEGINTLSGGNKYVAGVFSPTPDQIDYLLGWASGGVGREISKLDQTVTSMVSGDELPPYKIPLVGRFYGNAKSQSSEGTAFYANTAELNRIETEIKGLEKDGKRSEAAELRRGSDAYLITMANQAERQIQRLRSEKRELIKAGAPREQVAAIDARITAVMARLNRAAESLREKSEN